LGEKFATGRFFSKINDLRVKQSVHNDQSGSTRRVRDGSRTHVHNIGAGNRGWNSRCDIRQVPGGAAPARIMAAAGHPPGPATDAVLNDPAAAHAALTAFLRGVERRGAVLAHWQGGNAG